MTSILIALDDVATVSSLEKVLRASGYATTAARTGAQAFAFVRGDGFDMLILDVSFSDMTGQSVLRLIRREGATIPVIVVAVSGNADAAMLLEGGADDYMAKPYDGAELLARIRARLRPVPPPALDTLRAGDLRLDLRSRRCTTSGRVVELTTREFDLLEVLMRHPNQVLTRDQLRAQVWAPGPDSMSNIVDVYVRNLRRKLGVDIIHTVRGIGYRLAMYRRSGQPDAVHAGSGKRAHDSRSPADIAE